jgi:hypothetical protein
MEEHLENLKYRIEKTNVAYRKGWVISQELMAINWYMNSASIARLTTDEFNELVESAEDFCIPETLVEVRYAMNHVQGPMSSCD